MFLYRQRTDPAGIPSRKHRRGHLLSEYLVALGLLFLALVPNLAILHSATRTGEKSALSTRAVALLRDGMENAVSQPKKYTGKVTTESFGSGSSGLFDEKFDRRISLMPDKKSGMLLAIVVVKWGKDGQELALERYVRTD